MSTTPTPSQIAERLRHALQTAEEMAATRQGVDRHAYELGALQAMVEAVIIELEN